MKAYILSSGVRISPFDDDAKTIPILGNPLTVYVKALLRNEGLDPEPISGLDDIKEKNSILIADNLFITRSMLHDFIAGTRNKSETYNFCITKSGFTDHTTGLQKVKQDVGQDGRDCVRYPLYYLGSSKFNLGKSIPRAFRTLEKEVPLRRGEIVSGGKLKLTYPMTYRGAVAVSHWSHILMCNQLALTSRLFDTGIGRFAWKRIKPGSERHGPIRRFLRYRLGGMAVKKGRNCDIHPSAIVEASFIGDNVTIGPNAIVIGSYLGDGAEVQPAAQLFYCSLGKDAGVGQKSVHNLCVLYPSSFSGASMQYSVVGERAVTVYGGFVMDANLTKDFDRMVNVRMGGRQVNSGQMLLGACFGHRSITGTGIWISGGMEIPNDTFLVRDPDSTLREFTRLHSGKTVCIKRGKTSPVQGRRQGEDNRKLSAGGRRDRRSSGSASVQRRNTTTTHNKKETETGAARNKTSTGRKTEPVGRRLRKGAERSNRIEKSSHSPSVKADESHSHDNPLGEAEMLDANFLGSGPKESNRSRNTTSHRSPRPRSIVKRTADHTKSRSRRITETTDGRTPDPEYKPTSSSGKKEDSENSKDELSNGKTRSEREKINAVSQTEQKNPDSANVKEAEENVTWAPRKLRSHNRKSGSGKTTFLPGPLTGETGEEAKTNNQPEDGSEETNDTKSFGGRKTKIIGRRK